MNVLQGADNGRPASAPNARANVGAHPSIVRYAPALYPRPENASLQGNAAVPDTASNDMPRRLGHPLRTLRRWSRERQTYLTLSAMDDSLLKDIGICRSEILYFARQQNGEAASTSDQAVTDLGDDRQSTAWNARRAFVALLLIVASVVAMLGYDAMLEGLHAPAISLTALLGIMFAAICSSVAGFAFSALCGAILFHVIGTPVLAVEIMLLCSIAVQSVSVAALRNEIDLRSLGQLLAGGVVGLPVGVYALLHLGHVAFGAVFGAILIAFGIYRICRPSRWQIGNSALGNILAGMVGGVTGGLAAFPGVFVTVWCGLKGWGKARQRGVYQPYILIMQVLTMAALATASSRTMLAPVIDPALVAYVPAALIGTFVGLWFFRRISDQHFTIVVNLLLIAAGAGMEV